MEWVQWIHGTPQKTPASSLNPGDEVRVWYRILEQGKERLGQFEGTVLRTRGAGHSKTFSVRRVTFGEGVERVFPVDSKMIGRIEVLRRGKVKRATLYYLRTKIGKARIASEDAAPVKSSGPAPQELAGPSAAASTSAATATT